MKRWKLLLADDHDIVIEGLRRILDRPDFEIVGVVNDGQSLIRAARELHPDIVVVDITMPLLSGIEAARRIKDVSPKARIVFLTMHRDVSFATEALSAGGSGYVLKSSAGDDLAPAIFAALKGNTYVSKPIKDSANKALVPQSGHGRDPLSKLTDRQREVFQLLIEGCHVKEIAGKLNVSPRTVEFHKYRIINALGLHNIAELVRYAAKHGIVV